MKPNGSLRLCLDPKDLNKAIERNQWYSRTIDDILPELTKSKYKTLKDATLGYWHVVLDLASSLLSRFNAPWGKFRWLRLPFRLNIASDVFQERLHRVLRLLEGVHGIADDILAHGETEVQHDGRLLTLLETASMNNLSLNPDKIQFKSTDCKFFRHRLTPRRPQTRCWEDQGCNEHETTAVYSTASEFQWYDKLLKKMQRSLIWTHRTLEKTTEKWHSLGMGIRTTSSLWKDQDCTAYTSSLNTLQQGQGPHHSDWCIQNWTRCSLTTRRSACSLHM